MKLRDLFRRKNASVGGRSADKIADEQQIIIENTRADLQIWDADFKSAISNDDQLICDMPINIYSDTDNARSVESGIEYIDKDDNDTTKDVTVCCSITKHLFKPASPAPDHIAEIIANQQTTLDSRKILETTPDIPHITVHPAESTSPVTVIPYGCDDDDDYDDVNKYKEDYLNFECITEPTKQSSSSSSIRLLTSIYNYPVYTSTRPTDEQKLRLEHFDESSDASKKSPAASSSSSSSSSTSTSSSNVQLLTNNEQPPISYIESVNKKDDIDVNSEYGQTEGDDNKPHLERTIDENFNELKFERTYDCDDASTTGSHIHVVCPVCNCSYSHRDDEVELTIRLCLKTSVLLRVAAFISAVAVVTGVWFKRF